MITSSEIITEKLFLIRLKSDKQKQLMLAKKRLNELKKKSHLNAILEEDEIPKDATRSDIEVKFESFS